MSNFIRYDTYCNATAPSAIAALGTIPSGDFGSCIPILDSVDCVNDYGFRSGYDSPQNVKPTGTGSLENLDGSLESPLNGPKLVWSLADGLERTAIAAPFKGAQATGAATSATAT